MTKKIEHEWTNEIVCPWCGYEQSDSWDYHLEDDESTEIDCDCGHTYKATCCVTVNYSTEKIKGE